MLKYRGTLLAVRDIKAAAAFYTELFGQAVQFDFGAHIGFESGLALQQHFDQLAGVPVASMHWQPHNMELYFEVHELDELAARLRVREDVRWAHDIKVFPWGQRAFRVYDLDGHLLEVAEPMEAVVLRLLRQGMAVDEIAERVQRPIDYVRACIEMNR